MQTGWFSFIINIFNIFAASPDIVIHGRHHTRPVGRSVDRSDPHPMGPPPSQLTRRAADGGKLKANIFFNLLVFILLSKLNDSFVVYLYNIKLVFITA